MGGRVEARCKGLGLSHSARFAGKTGPALSGPVLFFRRLNTHPLVYVFDSFIGIHIKDGVSSFRPAPLRNKCSREELPVNAEGVARHHGEAGFGPPC